MGNRPTRAQFLAGHRWERPTAEALAAHLWPGSRVVEHREHSHIDLAVVSAEGRFICQLEVKTREKDHDDFDTTMVLWEKHDAGRFFKKFFNAPTLCVIVFRDRIGYFHLEETPDEKRKMGRKDRENSERWYALYSVARMQWVDHLREEIERRLAARPVELPEDDDIPSL